MRQADATSTATVSTHLALNAGQTTGYTYDDADPALTYTGTWTHAGPSSGYTTGDWDSTESWSQETGASHVGHLHRHGVQWIGPKNTNGGIADVYIDGSQAGTVDTYAVVRQAVPAVPVLRRPGWRRAATRSPSTSPASRTRPPPPTPW